MTKQQVIRLIQAKVKACEGQHRAADFYGISAQHLSDILAGRRALRGKILQSMGIEEVVSYKKVSA